MNRLLGTVLVLCLVPVVALASPAPVASTSAAPPTSTLATAVADALVKALVSHRDELAAVSERQARSATHGVIEVASAELGRAIKEDFATHGLLSETIANATAVSVGQAIDTSSKQLHLAIVEACGSIPLGDCIRAESRLISREMTAGAMDELRWPARILVASVSVFAILGSALSIVLLYRLLRHRDPRTRSLIEIIAPSP